MKKSGILLARAAAVMTVTLVLWSACHRQPVGDRIVVVSGKVLDEKTQQPIDSAWVALYDSLKGHLVFTDTTGSFVTSSYPILKATLFAGKNGYLTSSKLLEGIYHDTGGVVLKLVGAR